ncbi:MAG: GIY-YIG nuclease family protein [Candidatus Absconditabacterales bacterium]
MEKGFVYVLKLKNGKHYVGSTNNLQRRLHQHMTGKCISTKNVRPLELVYYKEYLTAKEARSVEYYLKKQKDKKSIQKFMDL